MGYQNKKRKIQVQAWMACQDYLQIVIPTLQFGKVLLSTLMDSKNAYCKYIAKRCLIKSKILRDIGSYGISYIYCKVLKVSTEIATPRFFFRSPRPVSSIPRRWGNLKNVIDFGESVIIDSDADDDWRMLTCDIYLHLLGNLCIYLYNLGNETLNCTYVSQ